MTKIKLSLYEIDWLKTEIEWFYKEVQRLQEENLKLRKHLGETE